MIFQDGNLSPAENARLSLASADQALNQASAGSGPAREQDLKLARAHLTHARKQMAMVTDTATRAQLDATLSKLEQRARNLDSEHGGHNPGDGHGTGPSTHGGNEERGPDGSGGPATNPGNDQPSPGGAPQPWRTSN